jgi:hypothetical protein
MSHYYSSIKTVFLFCLMMSSLAGCGNNDDTPAQPPVTNQNQAPVANAGDNRVVLSSVDITLDGGGSSDPEGDTLAYAWTLTRKPTGSTALLSSASTTNPSFTPDKDGLFIVTLVVSDGTSSSSPATVTIARSSPSCSTDDVLTSQTTGSMAVGPSEDFIPLCNGVVLYGDRELNQIRLLDVVSGGSGAPYQLTAAPKGLALDSDNGFLYAAQAPATFLTRMDLLSGMQSQITLGKGALNLTVGNGGRVFASLDDAAYYHPLALISGPAGTVEKVYAPPAGSNQYGQLLVYDRVHDQLITAYADHGYSMLSRHAFDPAALSLTELERLENSDYGGMDLALSPDGNHLAFASRDGNGAYYAAHYTIYDYSSTGLGYIYGEWDTGQYPGSVTFDKTGSRVAATDGRAIKVFDTTTHILLKTYPVELPDCSYAEVSKVRFSGGGNIMYAHARCPSTTGSDTLVWTVLEP